MAVHEWTTSRCGPPWPEPWWRCGAARRLRGGRPGLALGRSGGRPDRLRGGRVGAVAFAEASAWPTRWWSSPSSPGRLSDRLDRSGLRRGRLGRRRWSFTGVALVTAGPAQPSWPARPWRRPSSPSRPGSAFGSLPAATSSLKPHPAGTPVRRSSSP